MAFLDAWRRRRPYETPGFAGGYLDDQLERDQNRDMMYRYGRDDQPLTTTMNINRQELPMRPTLPLQQTPSSQQTPQPTTSPFLTRLAQGQARIPDEDFPQTRQRIAKPTEFDAQHLRDLESQPLGVRGKLGLVAQNIATNLGYTPLQTRRQRDIGEVSGRLGRDVALDDLRYKQQDSELKRRALKSEIEARQRRAEMEGLPQARYIERTDGVYEVSPAYPQGRKVGNVPSEVRRTAGERHYFERPDGVYVVNDEHPEGIKLGGVPGKPASDAQEAQAAEGEALAASTQKALEDEQKQLDSYKDQLTKNEAAIKAKDAWWRTQAAQRMKTAKENYEDLKMNEALDQVKAEDPDFQNGTYDTLANNTESLRKAVQESDKRVKNMQGTVRSGQAKGARSPQVAAPSGKPRVDHDKFQRDYEAAKTPAERARLMKLYQDALKIAGQ